jgi:hypothetical protein
MGQFISIFGQRYTEPAHISEPRQGHKKDVRVHPELFSLSLSRWCRSIAAIDLGGLTSTSHPAPKDAEKSETGFFIDGPNFTHALHRRVDTGVNYRLFGKCYLVNPPKYLRFRSKTGTIVVQSASRRDDTREGW